ncbi:hypothetical protein ABEB36_012056 [Hypothenemus hampei]|uniref:Uncharacterized protein n=1 Tax=Hypothenemus hampei TaxID=57062 RepID=A0ABD1EA04_HYPHA
METAKAIMENLDGTEMSSSQQCNDDKIIKIVVSQSPLNLDTEINATIINPASQEEPIDLTLEGPQNAKFDNGKTIILQRNQQFVKDDAIFSTIQNFSMIPVTEPTIIPMRQTKNSTSNCSYTIYRADEPNTSVNQFSSKQHEILKKAKSLFCKRTRTLYHWMYPSASKQHIKEVVSTTWDSMAVEEKNVYITQVLGKFGCHNVNLMINPQLEQIKELAPIPTVQEFHKKNTELQDAISSISTETTELNFGYEPPKKKVKNSQILMQNLSSESYEFADDPELNKEFTQFSNMFKDQF